jgi:GMP synthase (glutamine-hydrolysing)
MNILVGVIDYGLVTNIISVLQNLNVPFFIIDHIIVPIIKPTHIILSGGPDHVYEPNHRELPDWIINSNIHVLGICYGMQIICKTFGGLVGKLPEKENGIILVEEYINNNLYINNRWFNRFDNVYVCPPNFTILGVSDKNYIVSITDCVKYLGVQYHPENPNAIDYNFFIYFLSK